MDIYIENLFFTNVFISKEIKTQNIIYTIETKKNNMYELTTINYISTIELINGKRNINIKNFIDLFLIYEKQKCLNITRNIYLIKKNIRKYVVKLLQNNKKCLEQDLENFLKEFLRLVYLNILLYDKILKYDIDNSLIRFFNLIKDEKNIYLTPDEIVNKSCFICVYSKSVRKLSCCGNLICITCFNKMEFCPYCKSNFNTKIDLEFFEKKNINFL